MLSHRHIRRLDVAHRENIYLHGYKSGLNTGFDGIDDSTTDRHDRDTSQYFN